MVNRLNLKCLIDPVVRSGIETHVEVLGVNLVVLREVEIFLGHKYAL